MKHLYIHFPFCENRCDYCDFYSQAGGLELAPAYVEALLVELEAEVTCMEGGAGGGLETVFMGGGTPTLLGGKLLATVMTAVGGCCRPDAEITVEANPSTVTRELAETLATAGVNRVSLGAQSFSPVLRRNLGRRGTVEMIADAFAAFRGAGFKNVGLDLMFGIPGQDKADLDHDLKSVLALGPEHVSCYELTVREDSKFQRRWMAELEVAARSGRDYYETVVETLEAAGFRWYETSNFSRPGYECRHNLAYWGSEDFIGLGAGAWSSVGFRRWHNIDDLGVYLDKATHGDWEGMRDYEELSIDQRLAERLMLGLRRDTGVARSAIEDVIDAGQEKNLLLNGFIANEGGRIYITRRGRFVANEVCARFLRD